MRKNHGVPPRDQTPTPRPTLGDVAAAAGVSIATASRALGGTGDLLDDTRRAVLDAARSLDYERPRRGRPRHTDSRLIELVLGGFGTAWTDRVVQGARDAAFRRGYDLVLTLEREDPHDDWPARVARRRPSGIVLGIITPTRRQLDPLLALGIPLVLLDPRSDVGAELPRVGTTDREGGAAAGEHLARLPVDRFVVVTGAPPFRFGRAREEGFRAAIASLRPDALVESVVAPWGQRTPSDELVALLRRRERASADGDRIGVFAVTDDMALATYRAASTLGRTIARDVAVVGFDDSPVALRADPPLTSVRQPLAAMAARAVDLVDELRAGSDAHERIELPTQLIERGSTRLV